MNTRLTTTLRRRLSRGLAVERTQNAIVVMIVDVRESADENLSSVFLGPDLAQP